MSAEIPYYYYEQPKRSFNLESCWRIESKTRQFPFVVASDLAITPPASQVATAGSSSPNEPGEKAVPAVSYSDLLQGALTGHFVKPVQQISSYGTDDSGNTDDEHTSSRKQAAREFLIFHDLEHYLTLKDQFPHCHEIIRCPLSTEFESRFGEKSYRDDLCRGRLIFDFDLDQPLPEMESLCRMKSLSGAISNGQEPSSVDPTLFVPPNFKSIVEQLVVLVFRTYYVGVDASKLTFVWQITRHLHKFSMHLIVKHAYFSEYWVKQTRIFYCLFCRLASVNGVANITRAVDLQMARRNATFRILGCSKVGGKAIEIDCCNNNGRDLLDQGYPLTIYDCLVGIYQVEHLKAEQSISMDNINYLAIEQEVDKTKGADQTDEAKKFRTTITKQIKIAEENRAALNLDDRCIETAVALFDRFNDGSFAIRDQVGAIINLNRLRASPCPISGVRHENENAYLKMREDGRLIFCCRRGCKNNNFYGVDLGVYRKVGIIPLPVVNKDKEEMDDEEVDEEQDDKNARPKIVHVNRLKLEAATKARVLMVGVDIENPGGFVRKTPVKTAKASYVKPKKSFAKRATASATSAIYIPEGLKFPRLTKTK